MDGRVERDTDGVDLLDALAGEDVAEQRVDLLERPAGVVRLGLAAKVRGGEVEGVEHGEQSHAKPLGGMVQQLGLLAHRPLAEVVEVGLQTPERIEVLVALGCEKGCRRLRAERGVALGVGHDGTRAPVEEGVEGQVQVPVRLVAAAGVPGRLLGSRSVRLPVRFPGHEAAVPGSSTISASTTSSSEGLESLDPPEVSPAAPPALCCWAACS